MRAIDLFAGAGGFSLGAKMAGLEVVWAANHWPDAVTTHQKAFPGVEHACEDLHRVDWTMVPHHDLLLASPCCQGHSRGRGKDRPHHDAARSTAWAVIDAVEMHLPDAVIVENVIEFLDWRLYINWRAALMALGYSVCETIADAADAGVPQHRHRLFVCATRCRPLKEPLQLPKRMHRPASSFLRDIPAKTPIKNLCVKTRNRAAKGRHDHGDRFLLPYYSSCKGGRTIHAPIGTITTRDRYGLVEGDKMRMLTVDEYRDAMGFPAAYPLPDNRKLAIHLLGNSVPPMLACDVISSLVSFIQN